MRLALRRAMPALLTACLSLTACGGGGSGTKQPAAGSPAAPSPVTPAPVTPPVTAPVTPPPSPPPTAAESCAVNNVSYPLCSSEQGGWAFEGGKYCIARSFCPAKRSVSPTIDSRSKPVDGLASASTVATYSWLLSNWGSKIIAGQQDLTWRDTTDMAARVFNDTGKYPALMGYDFMNYGMSGVNGLRQTEEAIAWAAKGGLVTFAWHWRDPAKLKTAPNTAQFYAHDADPAKATSFTIPVAQGTLDKNSPAYQQLNDGIDLIAGELKKLAEAGVPVLWRPLHEASGYQGDGWFWWGRKRSDGVPQAYAQILLWRHLYDRLVNVHGLHNLIWVWNGQDPAWYPGDDVVDIMSTDIYDNTDNQQYRSQLPAYRSVQQMSSQKKIVALSENSFIPDPDKIKADGAWWAWFMVWNDAGAVEGVSDQNNFWTGEYYNTSEHKKKVYSHPDVITLDKLPQR